MLVKVSDTNIDQAKNYIRDNATGFDDYFTSLEALDTFDLEKNISYLSVNKEKIDGLMTIMLDYGVRLRYAHAASFDILKKLHHACIKHVPKYKVFIPASSSQVDDFYKLGLKYERSVYALHRRQAPIEVITPDPMYSVEIIDPHRDMDVFTQVRNIAFENLKGSEQRPSSYYQAMFGQSSYIKAANLLIRKDKEVVAVIKGSLEYENQVKQLYIGPLAVLPDYQGQGLGKSLLTHLIKLANDISADCSLSVNGDNEQALGLYKQLGFQIKREVIALI